MVSPISELLRML